MASHTLTNQCTSHRIRKKSCHAKLRTVWKQKLHITLSSHSPLSNSWLNKVQPLGPSLRFYCKLERLDSLAWARKLIEAAWKHSRKWSATKTSDTPFALTSARKSSHSLSIALCRMKIWMDLLNGLRWCVSVEKLKLKMHVTIELVRASTVLIGKYLSTDGSHRMHIHSKVQRVGYLYL